jgi:hypothetical protein
MAVRTSSVSLSSPKVARSMSTSTLSTSFVCDASRRCYLPPTTPPSDPHVTVPPNEVHRIDLPIAPPSDGYMANAPEPTCYVG